MLSIKYHRIFDYELVKSDFPKWLYKEDKSIKGVKNIKNKKRLQREKYSVAKLKIAKKKSRVLSKIPTIKFVGITGSLAMMNSDKNSDIDLIIITEKGTLWSTRLFAYSLIVLFGIQRRHPADEIQKDRLCLNMWIDETDLVWKKNDRNIYTAHEIAQIVPLVNKDKTYELFLFKNKWILDFWPNAVKIKDLEVKPQKLQKLLTVFSLFLIRPIEKMCFNIQYNYMKSKISREIITPTRAFFHPNDWGRKVLKRLTP